jgi:DNA-binding winged helix-turn-helix (wHTH) protein
LSNDIRGTILNRTDLPSSKAQTNVSNRTGSDPVTTFAGFRLEPDGSLFRGDALVHLPPRELAALRMLLDNAGQVVTAAQLKDALWGKVNVTADSVPKCLSSLRTRLLPADCIQTVYKRGYRLLADVKQLAPVSSIAVAIPRLAIPPFTAEPGAPEHLGTAISEELIYRLSNSARPMASILARDSVFTLASQGRTAQQIGENLEADLVLAGTLRALNGSIRLRVEMIRVADGVQVWVEDLLVDRDKLAGLDFELASRLDFRLRQWPLDKAELEAQAHPHARSAARLADSAAYKSGDGSIERSQGLSIYAQSSHAQSSGHHAAAPGSQPAPSLSSQQRREAHELYLRGHHEWQTLERHRMQDGLQLLTRAIELDPTLVAAKVDLVQLCSTQSLYGYMAPSAAAETILRTAASIPDLPHTADAILPDLAWVHLYYNRNLRAALWDFELSALLRHDVWVTRVRTMFALSRHRFVDAIEQLKAAIQLDPYSPWLHNRLAWALHLDGQAKASGAAVEHSMRLFPDHEATFLYCSIIAAYNGEIHLGLQLAEKLLIRQPSFDPGHAIHAYTLACAGRADEARTVLERMQWLSRERFVIGSYTPAVHVVLGDHDAAIAELQANNEQRDPWFFQMLADPRLKPLHGNPKFEELRAILPAMEAAAQP